MLDATPEVEYKGTAPSKVGAEAWSGSSGKRAIEENAAPAQEAWFGGSKESPSPASNCAFCAEDENRGVSAHSVAVVTLVVRGVASEIQVGIKREVRVDIEGSTDPCGGFRSGAPKVAVQGAGSVHPSHFEAGFKAAEVGIGHSIRRRHRLTLAGEAGHGQNDRKKESCMIQCANCTPKSGLSRRSTGRREPLKARRARSTRISL